MEILLMLNNLSCETIKRLEGKVIYTVTNIHLSKFYNNYQSYVRGDVYSYIPFFLNLSIVSISLFLISVRLD